MLLRSCRSQMSTSTCADTLMGMHPNAERVARVLAGYGVSGTVRELPEPAPTAATANSLVFNADGVPLLVLTSGAHRVDTTKVATLLGAESVRRADPDFVRS